jgi:hypothetical protein
LPANLYSRWSSTVVLPKPSIAIRHHPCLKPRKNVITSTGTQSAPSAPSPDPARLGLSASRLERGHPSDQIGAGTLLSPFGFRRSVPATITQGVSPQPLSKPSESLKGRPKEIYSLYLSQAKGLLVRNRLLKVAVVLSPGSFSLFLSFLLSSVLPFIPGKGPSGVFPLRH